MFGNLKEVLLPKSVTTVMWFEYRSLIGRIFSTPLRVPSNRDTYLNIGCGDTPTNEFVNIDFFGTPDASYHADLRYPLQIANESISGVFSEHTIEHLSYPEVQRLYSELFRVMKPGACLRVIVPDIGKFVDRYSAGDTDWFAEHRRLMFEDSASEERRRRSLKTPMESISFTANEYGHRSCWDFKTMKHYLESAGFEEVTHCEWRDGTDPKLLVDFDTEDRKYVSLHVECRKRMDST